MVNDLIELNPNEEEIDLYANLFSAGCIRYYKEIYDLDWLNVHHVPDDNFDYDYYFLWYDNDYREEMINNRNLKVVYYYPIGDIYLFE